MVVHTNAGVVQGVIDSLPGDERVVVIPRREDHLLQTPPESPLKLWRDYELLPSVHFSQQYTPTKFVPPHDVYGGDFLRLEW